MRRDARRAREGCEARSVAARALLVSGDEHQQLHGSETSLYGILADLVCGLDGAAEEIGFLHFALTGNLFVSSRRHYLNAIEATKRALRRGLKVKTPSALLETITGQMIETLDHYADGLAGQLDRAEERILADEFDVDRQVVGSVRRMTVRLIGGADARPVVRRQACRYTLGGPAVWDRRAGSIDK